MIRCGCCSVAHCNLLAEENRAVFLQVFLAHPASSASRYTVRIRPWCFAIHSCLLLRNCVVQHCATRLVNSSVARGAHQVLRWSLTTPVLFNSLLLMRRGAGLISLGDYFAILQLAVTSSMNTDGGRTQFRVSVAESSAWVIGFSFFLIEELFDSSAWQ